MVVPVCSSFFQGCCALTIYEIVLPTVEGLEKKVNICFRSWLGLPPGMPSVALYNKSAKKATSEINSEGVLGLQNKNAVDIKQLCGHQDPRS